MIDLSNIQSLYENRLRCEVRADTVREDTLREMVLNLRTVVRTIGPSDSHLSLLNPIRRYAYLLPASLLPLNDEAWFPLEGTHNLLSHQSALAAAYPSLREPLERLLNTLERLRLDSSTPLLDRVAGLMRDRITESVGILVKEKGLFEATKALVEARLGKRHLVLLPRELSNMGCLDRLYVPGPSVFYPGYLLCAPRATHIQIVHYSWSRDSELPSKNFDGLYRPSQNSARVIAPPVPPSPEDTLSSQDFEALRPQVDAKSVAKRYYYSGPDADDLVEARLVELEGEQGVFLKEDAYTVDPSVPTKKRVEKVPLETLEEGDYIALRTSRGHDYVAEVADQLLGKEAQILRSKLREWKTRLREQVRQKTAPVVSRDLTTRGARFADPLNVRNWMSEFTLGPGSAQDFVVLLQLLGLKNDANSYQESLQQLRTAHRKAGREIRRQLIQQVEQSDLRQLEEEGQQIITLPDEDGGSIGIYRVIALAREFVEVPYKQLGKVIRIR